MLNIHCFTYSIISVIGSILAPGYRYLTVKMLTAKLTKLKRHYTVGSQNVLL